MRIRLGKLLMLGGLVAGAMVVAKKVRGGGSAYEDDEIDSAEGEGTFGERGAEAPEQQMSIAETRTDVTPEELAMAARVETSMGAIREVFPTISEDEIKDSEGDLDKLADVIAGKVQQPREQVKQRLEGILASETPRPSFPAQ